MATEFSRIFSTWQALRKSINIVFKVGKYNRYWESMGIEEQIPYPYSHVGSKYPFHH